MPGYMWPNGLRTKPYVSSAFGPRVAPKPGASTYHRGADFSHTFSDIRAVADGQVKVVGYKNGWPGGGNMVWVQHDGFFTRSLHMSSTSVVNGQFVRAGDKLGVMGKTGTATDTHLHFELTPGAWHSSNTGQIDPVPFLTAKITGSSSSGGAGSEDDDMFTDQDRANQLSILTALGAGDLKPGQWSDTIMGNLRAVLSEVNGLPSGLSEIKSQVNGLPTALADIRAHVGVSEAQVKQIADAVANAIGQPTVTVDYARIAKEVNDVADQRSLARYTK